MLATDRFKPRARGHNDAYTNAIYSQAFRSYVQWVLQLAGSGYAASQLMVYPGTEVFITRNSTGNSAQAKDSDMLAAAWQAALVGGH